MIFDAHNVYHDIKGQAKINKVGQNDLEQESGFVYVPEAVKHYPCKFSWDNVLLLKEWRELIEAHLVCIQPG